MSSSFSSNPRLFRPGSVPPPAIPREPAAPFRVAILGFGTVGRSVARILCESTRPGVRLTHICNRNVMRKRVPWVPPRVRWTESVEEVLCSDVDVIVELVGGLRPAGDWVRAALECGKSVVTANKQLIAYDGPELLAIAREHGCQLLFGASVAGGVPVLSGLEQGLAGDRLSKLCGILNGTCNYILTRIEAGVSFEEALREAQKLGFAEADPTDDIEGFDARAKLTILARTALHSSISPSDVVCAPIHPISRVDFAYAANLGCTIRQISRAEVQEDRLFAAVQPAVVPLSSPLARVQGSENLVIATGQYGGETVFSGFGAGGDPTAVAVVSDLVALYRTRSNDVSHGYPALPPHRPVTSEFSSRHLLRFTVADRPGIIAALAGILAKYEINIDAVFQKPGFPKSQLPFVISLEECSATALDAALKEIGALDFLVAPTLSLPVLA